jgi:hypothetical protein
VLLALDMHAHFAQRDRAFRTIVIASSAST